MAKEIETTISGLGLVGTAGICCIGTIENIFPHSLQTTCRFFRGRLRLLKLDRIAVRITGPLMPILERCMGARPA